MFHNLGDFKHNTQHVPKLITKALDALSGGISASMHVKTLKLTTTRALKRYLQREVQTIRRREGKLPTKLGQDVRLFNNPSGNTTF